MPLKNQCFVLLACAAAGSLGGCAYSPTAGPSRAAIIDGQDGKFVPYAVVEVTPAVLDILKTRPRPGLSETFGVNGADAPLGAFVLGAGDVVAAAIFDPSITAGASFDGAPTRSGSIIIPKQTIAADGLLSIPYAGRIRAKGRTVQQLQSAIERALQGRLPNPQVVLSLESFRSKSVTVTGAVAAPGVFPLNGANERILDAVAGAGGTRGPISDATLYVTRGGKRVSTPLDSLVDNPPENIRVQPGDIIVVEQEQRIFTAIGFTGRTGNFPIDRRRMTVMQAVGAAGGLNDEKATPTGVFLFRLEEASIASKLGVAPSDDRPPTSVPVIYDLNFKKAESLFLAQSMPIEPNDVLYVSEARTSALYKFLRIIGATTSTVATPIAIARP